MNKYIAAALAEDFARRAQEQAARKVAAERVDGMITYNAEAVDREIRRDPRIKGREAAAIHALLKGRH